MRFVVNMNSKRKKCILILADDDEDDRMFFQEAWSEIENVELILAENGEDFLDKLFSMKDLPTAIFLDLNMPKKNGKACLQEIKKHKEYKDIPVIIYSTTSNKIIVEELYSEGANLYITKPQSYKDIVKTMQAVYHLNADDYIPQPVKERFYFVSK
jgi:response regulator RpfG family c-di-GMP phosphodiesterase